jgi:hypothetical protein
LICHWQEHGPSLVRRLEDVPQLLAIVPITEVFGRGLIVSLFSPYSTVHLWL